MSRKLLSGSSIVFCAAVGAGLILLSLPTHLPAQSLDEAVTAQLRTISGIACAELRRADPLTVLKGGLNEICSRTVGVGDSPGADATGGGAGTPTSLPSIVEKRLKEVRGDSDETASDVPQPTATWESGRLGAFISAEVESLDRDVTTFEDGYDSDIWRLTLGTDYMVSEHGVAGAALVFSRQHGDFDSGGDFDVDSYGLLLFGTFRPSESTFIQVTGGYYKKSSDRTRVATFVSDDTTPFSRTGSPKADFDASEFSTGVLLGKDFVIRNVTIGPRIGLDWTYTDFDEYSEEDNSGLALRFHGDEIISMQTAIGVQATAAISTRFGVISPQVSLSWKQEFANDQRDVRVSFVDDTRSKIFNYETEPPDRHFFEVGAGVAATLPRGFTVFVNYRTLLNHSFYDSHAGTIGLRLEL